MTLALLGCEIHNCAPLYLKPFFFFFFATPDLAWEVLDLFLNFSNRRSTIRAHTDAILTGIVYMNAEPEERTGMNWQMFESRIDVTPVSPWRASNCRHSRYQFKFANLVHKFLCCVKMLQAFEFLYVASCLITLCLFLLQYFIVWSPSCQCVQDHR